MSRGHLPSRGDSRPDDRRGPFLEDRFQSRGRERNLRWIYVHMIEEYARHNGHADLIRERLDGVTGY